MSLTDQQRAEIMDRLGPLIAMLLEDAWDEGAFAAEADGRRRVNPYRNAGAS